MKESVAKEVIFSYFCIKEQRNARKTKLRW